MQILGKFIAGNTIEGSKIRLLNTQYLRARNAANSADVDMIRVSSADRIEFASLPQAAGTPSLNNDLVNLSFLKLFIDGARDPKSACRVATTADIVLAPAPAAIDGVTLVTGDRVLVKDQSLGELNGIYTFDGTDLVRSTDADEDAEVTQGISTMVIEGVANGNSQWVLQTQDPIVLGTTALTFVQIPTPAAVVGGDMITVSGSSIAVDLAAVSGLESTNPGNVAGQLRVKLDTASPAQEQTLVIDPSNNLQGLKGRYEKFVLGAGDITNQYVDLAEVAHAESIILQPVGGPVQEQGVDYTINYTGGVAGVTRITFAGGLATAGASELVAGDELLVRYASL